MKTSDRIAARLAPTRFPVGAVMAFISVMAFLTIVLLGFATIRQRPIAAMLLLLWCGCALVVAAINIRQSIAMMGATDWRPMIPVAVLSALIVATYPDWYM